MSVNILMFILFFYIGVCVGVDIDEFIKKLKNKN